MPRSNDREEMIDDRDDPTLGDIVGRGDDLGTEVEEAPAPPPPAPLTAKEKEDRAERNQKLAQVVTQVVIAPLTAGALASTGGLTQEEVTEHANRILNQTEQYLATAYTIADTDGLLGSLENLPIWARILVSVGGTGILGVSAVLSARRTAGGTTPVIKKKEV